MEELNNDLVRSIFLDSGFDYADIKRQDLNYLEMLIKNELLCFGHDGFTMKLSVLRIKDIEFKDGQLVKAYFGVDGFIDHSNNSNTKKGKFCYFKRREAISFNSDGFIGFAGWADSRNVQPFLKVFKEWVSYLVDGHMGT